MATLTDLTLLQKFAPVMYLHPDETNLPCSADWFLTQCKLTDQNGHVVPLTQNGITNSDDLIDMYPGQKKKFHLQVLDSSTYAGQPPQPGVGITTPCYGYVRPVTDANHAVINYDLNYWWFYAFNGNTFNIAALVVALSDVEIAAISASLWFIGAGLLPLAVLVTAIVETVRASDGIDMHEGDWVTTVVRLSSDQSTIEQIYLAQHDSGQWCGPSDIPGWTTDHRPYLYAAKASHEVYPSAEDYQRINGLATDRCAQGLA
jgi:hypothetical protein